MKLFRTHFTVRRLMVGVAIVAVCLELVAMRQRAANRLAMAQFHAAQAAEQRSIVEDWKKGNVRLHNMTPKQAEAVVEACSRRAAYHEAMSRKWEEFARFPGSPSSLIWPSRNDWPG